MSDEREQDRQTKRDEERALEEIRRLFERYRRLAGRAAGSEQGSASER